MKNETAAVREAPLIQIGGATQESVEQVSTAILAVLASAAGDSVKQAAIAAIGRIGSADHVTISSCSFTGSTARV